VKLEMSSPPLWSLEAIVAVCAVGVGLIVISLFILAGRKPKGVERQGRRSPPPLKAVKSFEPPSFKVERSLTDEDVEKARDELRILNLERDILSNVITRLFEAEDEGKITSDERERMAKTYQEYLKDTLKKIRRNELIIRLYELEKSQEELVKTFNEKFYENKAEIEKIRAELKITPVKKPPKPPVKKVVRKAVRKPEVEEEVEKLLKEVLKELEELEKIEVET